MEERRAKEAEKLKEAKDKISAITTSGCDPQQGVASGMVIDDGIADEAEEDDLSRDGAAVVRKMPARKTKQQKAKAARLRAEVSYSCLCTSSTPLSHSFT